MHRLLKIALTKWRIFLLSGSVHLHRVLPDPGVGAVAHVTDGCRPGGVLRAGQVAEQVKDLCVLDGARKNLVSPTFHRCPQCMAYDGHYAPVESTQPEFHKQ